METLLSSAKHISTLLVVKNPFMSPVTHQDWQVVSAVSSIKSLFIFSGDKLQRVWELRRYKDSALTPEKRLLVLKDTRKGHNPMGWLAKQRGDPCSC